MSLFVYEYDVPEIFIKQNRILVYSALKNYPENFLQVKRNSKIKNIRE